MDEQMQEYLDEKEVKKRKVMTEKEIKEADMFLDWYRKGYTDKSNRNLFAKWEEIEHYWEGDIDIDDENADETEPMSNTNITNSNVEGKVALLCDQNIGIQVDPIEPSDRPFCNRVKILADFIKDKNKMYRKIDVHERRREKYGTGIFRVLWDFKKLDGMGFPEIEVIHPARIVIDPCITDVYKIQDAKYIIEVCNKSVYSARLKYGDEIADAIIPNLDPVSQSFKTNYEEEQYLHMFVWTRYKDKKDNIVLRLVEMSGCGVILSDTKKKIKEANEKKREETAKKKSELIAEGKLDEADKIKEEEIRLFPNDTYPYFFSPDMYRENSIWGKGSAELLPPISDQIDEIDNQVLMNARLAGNPVRIVGTNTGIDVDKITNEPGQIILTNDVNGTKWETPPALPAYIITRRSEIINTDRPIVTRFNDQMIGNKQNGVNTATESLALQQSGNSMIEHKKGILQETLAEVYEYAIELALLNWDTEMTFRITGDKGEQTFEDFTPSSLNNVPLLMRSNTEYQTKYKEKHKDAKPSDYEYMQVGNETRKVKFDLQVTVGAGMPSNKAFRYQLISESFAKGAITKKEYRKYLVNNVGLDVQEVPESEEEQREIGIYSEETLQKMQEAMASQQAIEQQQSPNIAGINGNGNVSINKVKEAYNG